ncbi:uncharacterized protein [Onthophagus taurus]|uniref:uncharacterized protein n=1 Tax=Onthophagus taurus TaxID=166361 RepID=UPI0039BDBA3D
MSFSNLRVGEGVFSDNSIVNCEYHSHQPYAATTFNNNDEIRIPIQTQDVYTLPSQSYLYVEGKLLKDDGKTISKDLHFVNNGITFLFDEIRYELAGTAIDRTRNPGITTTLKTFASYTVNQCTRLENAGWNHTQHPQINNKNGYFSVCIPLSMLLGFAEDFPKIIMNVRQELVLIRSNTDLNCVINVPVTGTDKPKIDITKIMWKMPHVAVADIEKLRLMKYIDKDLEVAFRSWELQELPLLQTSTRHTWTVKTTSQLEKPRFIIFALQTDRKNSTGKSMSEFDDCNLTNVKLYLNSDVYPYDNMNLNFEKNQWSILYEMYAQFQKSYYFKNGSDGGVEPCLSPINFKHFGPFVVIDCSHQSEAVKTGAVDIRLEFETSQNVPDKTTAYCLILHDRLIKYNPLTSVIKIF